MKTKKAAGLTAAQQNEVHFGSYQKAESESTLKSEIGTLLLCLQFPVGRELNHIGWVIFERRLRQYVDLIQAEGTV